MDCAGDNNGMTFQRLQDYRNTLETDRASDIIFLVLCARNSVVAFSRSVNVSSNHYYAVVFVFSFPDNTLNNHVENNLSLSQITPLHVNLFCGFSRCIYSIIPHHCKHALL